MVIEGGVYNLKKRGKQRFLQRFLLKANNNCTYS